MKINFEHFSLFNGIDRSKVTPMDVRRVFAEELYNRGQGIACHALALKIYNSVGETEYSDDEYGLMVSFAEYVMTPSFIDSLKMLKI